MGAYSAFDGEGQGVKEDAFSLNHIVDVGELVMASTPSLPPFITRQRSRVRVPGGFDTDEELSPIKTEFGAHEIEHHGHIKDSVDYSSSPTPLPQDDDSLLPAPDDQDGDRTHKDMSLVNESEMRRKLMDVESSFLPELSPAGPPRAGGADDTYDFGAFKGGMDLQSHPNAHKVEGDEGGDQRETTEEDLHEDDMQLSPPTPPESYQTPAPSRIDDLPDGPTSQDDSDPDYHANTSSLETMSSSPTAAAAARTVSRVVSMATIGGYETADDRSSRRVSRKKGTADARDPEVTPRKTYDPSSPSSRTASPTPTKPQQDQEAEEAADGDVDEIGFDLKRQRKRPKFLRSRQQSQRSSYSSNTTTSTDPASDITVGADFALQSGGAAPDDNSINRPIMELSRSTSLGSMASGVSGLSDGDGQLDKARAVSSINDGGLAKLDEEETEYSETGTRRGRRDFSAPATPRATSRTLNVPTDTVIAQHVRNVQVPASVEQDYREKHQSSSPDKRVGMPTPSIGRSGKNMTLKEQSSTIERLGKENWDLKVKIWCLEKNLNDRSEEGVSDLISANVELRTDKLKLQREMRELRRTIRELERKLKEKEEVISKAQAGGPDQNSSPGTNGAGFQEIEEEVTYLRERVETYEVEIEKLRSEGTAREGEKRRLAGVVKSMGDRRSGESDIGVREELVSQAKEERSFLVRFSRVTDNKRYRICGKICSRLRRQGGKKQMKTTGNFAKRSGD